MAALDAIAALQVDSERFKGVPEFVGGLPAKAPATRRPTPGRAEILAAALAEPAPDDWCELRLETRTGKIRMTWKSADGDMRDSEWRLRERSNTQLALFVGFLKSFVAKSFGRVPVLKQENVAPLDKPGEPV